jgi:hypothetical protein
MIVIGANLKVKVFSVSSLKLRLKRRVSAP